MPTSATIIAACGRCMIRLPRGGLGLRPFAKGETAQGVDSRRFYGTQSSPEKS